MIMLRSSPSSDSSSQRTLITPYRSGAGTPEEEEELALLQRLEQEQQQPRQHGSGVAWDPQPPAHAAEALPELPSQPSSSWQSSWEMRQAEEPQAKMPVQSWPPGLQQQRPHLPPQPGWDEEVAAVAARTPAVASPWHAPVEDVRLVPPRAGGEVPAVPGWAVGSGQPQQKQAWTSADAGLQPLERASLLPSRSGLHVVATPAAQTLDAPGQVPGTEPAAPKAPAGAGAGTPAQVPLAPPPAAAGQSQTGGPPRPKPAVDLTPITQGKNPLRIKNHYSAKTPLEEKLVLRQILLSLKAPPGERLPRPIAHLQHWLNVEGRGPADKDLPLEIPFSELEVFQAMNEGKHNVLRLFADHEDGKVLGKKRMFDWLRGTPNTTGKAIPVPDMYWQKIVSGKVGGLLGGFGLPRPGHREFFYSLGDSTLTGRSSGLRGYVHPNGAAAMQGDITFTLTDRYDWNKKQGVTIPITVEMLRKYLPPEFHAVLPDGGEIQVADDFFHDLKELGYGRDYDIKSESAPFSYEFFQSRPVDSPSYKRLQRRQPQAPATPPPQR